MAGVLLWLLLGSTVLIGFDVPIGVLFGLLVGCNEAWMVARHTLPSSIRVDCSCLALFDMNLPAAYFPTVAAMLCCEVGSLGEVFKVRMC